MSYINIQLGIVVFFLVMSYLIEKKKFYGLISNYNGRTEEEKAVLRANRYPERLGRLFRYIALGLLVFVGISWFDIPYVEELSFLFMLAMVFGGFIHLSKYEVEGKRKHSYWIGVLLAVGTTLFIGILSYLGYRESPLVAGENTFEIQGAYGERWSYDEVEEVKLVDEMPSIQTKIDGYGMSNRAKGEFRINGKGDGKLFLYFDRKPYILIEFTEGNFVYINASDPEQTKNWYDDLVSHLK